MSEIPSSDALLTRKEVCFFFRRDRTTVWRWEREGLRFRDGRVTAAEVAWFLERRDAALMLGIKVRVFMAKPRKVQEKLLTAAVVARSMQHSAT